MTLEQLKYFIDVAETKNMTLTSGKFYMSPQGISRSLKALQQELGIDLFQFSKGKIELTQEGIFYYTKIKDLVAQIDKVNEELKSKENKTLRIAISSYTYRIVSAILEEYQNQHPDQTLLIAEYPDKTAEQKIMEGKADLAFISGPISNREIKHDVLVKKEDYLCVPQSNVLSQFSSLSFEDIKDEPFITMNNEHKIYDCYVMHMRAMSCSPKIIFHAASLSAVKEAMKVKKALSMGNPQYDLSIEGFVKIPLKDKNLWQLSIGIHRENSSDNAGHLYQFILNHAHRLNVE